MIAQITWNRIFYFAACVAFAHGSYPTIGLQQVGFNFFSQFSLGNQDYTVIIDTGNGMFTLVRPNITSLTRVSNSSSSVCLYLLEDTTEIMYSGYKAAVDNSCNRYSGVGGFPDSGAEVDMTVTAANETQIANVVLHPWMDISGDIGLGYCDNNAACFLTPFQLLLINATEAANETTAKSLSPTAGSSLMNSNVPMLFGLDLSPDRNNSEGQAAGQGSLQLGFVSPSYAASMQWYRQATPQPQFHITFIGDLNMCGVNLLGSYGNAWPAIIDSGQVCLQLPEEVYDTMWAWLDSTDIASSRDLPALSFQVVDTVNGTSDTLYLPLENLLVEPIIGSGAATVTVAGTPRSLCVLKSGVIDPHRENSPYNSPTIVLGTLALASMYFAADFSAGTVGLSSKLNASEELFYSSGPAATAYCKAPVTCIGDQNYEESSNSCLAPSCESYFFVYVDAATQTCKYKSASVGWGLFFILLIGVLEILSFFAGQQTTLDYYQSVNGAAGVAVEGPLGDGAVYNAVKVDYVTRCISPVLTSVVDFLVVYVFKWSEGRPVHPHVV